MISIGTAIILLFTSLSISAKAFRNIQVNSTDVVTGLNKLPALPIGFGVFLLFTRTEFHSGIINGMAKGAFAVYLITDYPASEQLWNGPFDLYMISMHPIQLLWVFGALIVIYLVCTVFDLIRQALFSVTIDVFGTGGSMPCGLMQHDWGTC